MQRVFSAAGELDVDALQFAVVGRWTSNLTIRGEMKHGVEGEDGMLEGRSTVDVMWRLPATVLLLDTAVVGPRRRRDILVHVYIVVIILRSPRRIRLSDRQDRHVTRAP